MPGIVDVAKRAGVSITTASRVLNHVDYPVAPATRRRVEEAARELQYSPSALARALVTRHSGIVGVLVGDMVDPYFAEIARGVEDAARRAGYLVVVCNTDREPVTERRYVATLSDYRVEALIFVGGDIVAAAELAEYLLSLGHRRIGFIGGRRNISTAGQREAGFRAALTTAGLTPSLIVDGDFTYAGGFEAASRLLADHGPTAIFAANDQMALGALNAARAAGLHVPDDVTVVGFGDTGAAEHAAPALTTVSMPRHQLGSAAMQALLAALAAKTSRVEPRQLPYRIVLRESSAPPRVETQAQEERIA